VKHAAVCSSRFGQERPQCDQSAMRRFVGRWRCPVGQREGDCNRSPKNDCDRQVAKEITSFKSDAASNPSGRGFGSRPELAFSGMPGVRYPNSDALNLAADRERCHDRRAYRMSWLAAMPADLFPPRDPALAASFRGLRSGLFFRAQGETHGCGRRAWYCH